MPFPISPPPAPAAPLWWTSWWDTDSRPNVWPPPVPVVGLWESGWRDATTAGGDPDEVSVVAIVRAADENAAWAIVEGPDGWAPIERRFARITTAPPGDRFPPSPWAVADGRWPWLVTP